jgi:hypothetical protein
VADTDLDRTAGAGSFSLKSMATIRNADATREDPAHTTVTQGATEYGACNEPSPLVDEQ